MRPARALGIYFAVVFTGGPLLAPWLYKATQWMASGHPGLMELADNPFHRYVNRAILGLTLLGLWPFFRSIRMHSWRDLGLGRDSRAQAQLWGGFGVGFVSLAIVAILALSSEARVLNAHYTIGDFAFKIATAALAAAVVGIMEEIVFRGALFGSLRKVHSWITALLLSSALYALVHFFQKPESPEQVDWLSGFVILGQMLGGMVEPQSLVPGFFVLTMAGAILACGYQRTGKLYFSIGLHAGWVFWMKFYGAATSSQPGANTWFWGSGKLYDGCLSGLVLTLVLLICMVWGRNRTNEETKPHP